MDLCFVFSSWTLFICKQPYSIDIFSPHCSVVSFEWWEWWNVRLLSLCNIHFVCVLRSNVKIKIWNRDYMWKKIPDLQQNTVESTKLWIFRKWRICFSEFVVESYSFVNAIVHSTSCRLIAHYIRLSWRNDGNVRLLCIDHYTFDNVNQNQNWKRHSMCTKYYHVYRTLQSNVLCSENSENILNSRYSANE